MATAQVHKRAAAGRDLVEHYVYLGEQAGIDTAERFLTQADESFRDLAAYPFMGGGAGAAPITRQSGKKKIVLMRNSCNPRMRNAQYHWSRVSVQCDDRSRDHYAEWRRVGHSHGRALRGVVDRLLAVPIAILKSGTLYDPNRRKEIPEQATTA